MTPGMAGQAHDPAQADLPCLALPWLGLACVISSCSKAPSDHSTVAGTPAPPLHVGKPGPTPNQSYDFGTILADGQTLHHEFVLRNTAGRPIRPIGSKAVTPCCSSIGPLPESIPPGGEARIPTALRPGHEWGLKRVSFLLETDWEEWSVIQLALQARLISAWQVEPVGRSAASIPSGRSGKIGFRVVARRNGSAGRDLPDEISAAPPLVASFQGRPTTTTGSDGWIEAARDVAVSIPAASQPGVKRSEVRFRWSDGHSEVVPVGREVRPPLKVTPAGLVLRHSGREIEQSIVVESDGLPFRVTAVTSPILAEPVKPSREPGRRHVIPVKIDLRKRPVDRVLSITIATDDPDQPAVDLSVLVLSDADAKGDAS